MGTAELKHGPTGVDRADMRGTCETTRAPFCKVGTRDSTQAEGGVLSETLKENHTILIYSDITDYIKRIRLEQKNNLEQ